VFVIAFGESDYPALSWIRRYGDISYGVYIWGWPVQQALVHLLHPSQTVLAFLSIPLAWIIGAISWHLLEKKVLRLKLALPAQRVEEPVVEQPQVQAAFRTAQRA
jgi:peptidoglycan/LPS O-acetylase OafA/YrhL